MLQSVRFLQPLLYKPLKAKLEFIL
jgi:hypothetical protein